LGAHRRSPVTVRVAGKVNLELRVGPRRHDGHHDLATVFMAVSIHDDVTLRPASQWSLAVSGSDAAAVPTDETNLAWRAALAVAHRAGVDEAAAIEIVKDIPVAGGMAGGSADGAAALVAANHLWDAGLSRAELLSLAQDLGADVPFSLTGGVAVGSGRGDLLVPALARGTYHWVLVGSDEGLSTAAVFATLDAMRAQGQAPEAEVPATSSALLAALAAGDVYALAENLANDLDGPATRQRPELGKLLAAGLDFGALAGIISGSGPTLAFLVASHEAALHLAIAFTASGTATRVRTATGPVPGAQVVTAVRGGGGAGRR
jgi:4-diphosphocytidyl-2-C-methyl-D-erythritol kinase